MLALLLFYAAHFTSLSKIRCDGFLMPFSCTHFYVYGYIFVQSTSHFFYRIEFLSCLCIVLTPFVALFVFHYSCVYTFIFFFYLLSFSVYCMSITIAIAIASIFRCGFLMFSFWLNIWYIHFLAVILHFAILSHTLSFWMCVRSMFLFAFARVSILFGGV